MTKNGFDTPLACAPDSGATISEISGGSGSNRRLPALRLGRARRHPGDHERPSGPASRVARPR